MVSVLRDNKVEIKLSEPVADEIDEEAAEEPKPVKKAAKEKAEDKEAEDKKARQKSSGERIRNENTCEESCCG